MESKDQVEYWGGLIGCAAQTHSSSARPLAFECRCISGDQAAEAHICRIYIRPDQGFTV